MAEMSLNTKFEPSAVKRLRNQTEMAQPPLLPIQNSRQRQLQQAVQRDLENKFHVINYGIVAGGNGRFSNGY